MPILYDSQGNLIESSLTEDEREELGQEGQTCMVCGCTDGLACEGGCSWARANLCSNCVDIADDLDLLEDDEEPEDDLDEDEYQP